MAQKRMTIYLSEETQEKLQAIARKRKRSVSSLVSASVEQQLQDNASVVPESAVRQLARIEARLDKSIRDAAMLKEIMLLFVRVWLEYTPPLAEDEEDDAAALAELRFERFLDHVRDAMAPGRSLMNSNGQAASS
jgi:predicted transcriptional regulator